MLRDDLAHPLARALELRVGDEPQVAVRDGALRMMFSLLAAVPLIATVSYVTSVPPTMIAELNVRYCSPPSCVRNASRMRATS